MVYWQPYGQWMGKYLSKHPQREGRSESMKKLILRIFKVITVEGCTLWLCSWGQEPGAREARREISKISFFVNFVYLYFFSSFCFRAGFICLCSLTTSKIAQVFLWIKGSKSKIRNRPFFGRQKPDTIRQKEWNLSFYSAWPQSKLHVIVLV